MRVLLSACESFGEAGPLPCRWFSLGRSPVAKDCEGSDR
jgi:hypothetical protein